MLDDENRIVFYAVEYNVWPIYKCDRINKRELVRVFIADNAWVRKDRFDVITCN